MLRIEFFEILRLDLFRYNIWEVNVASSQKETHPLLTSVTALQLSWAKTRLLAPCHRLKPTEGWNNILNSRSDTPRWHLVSVEGSIMSNQKTILCDTRYLCAGSVTRAQLRNDKRASGAGARRLERKYSGCIVMSGSGCIDISAGTGILVSLCHYTQHRDRSQVSRYPLRKPRAMLIICSLASL